MFLIMFAYSYGLSYTTFAISNLSTSFSLVDDEEVATLIVTVKNTGKVKGSEAVQIYVAYPDIGLAHPPLLLKGFAKAKDLEPGASTELSVTLDKHAISFWDTRRNSWKIAKGVYQLHVGFSSEEMVLSGQWEVKKERYWKGL
jgi:beta-glucosidase